jgi:hypothetical protein
MLRWFPRLVAVNDTKEEAMTVKGKIAAGVIALAALAGGGAAIAATQTTPEEESQAILNDAAAELGVTPEKLADALEQALSNRVDAAVAAGRLTEEQAADLKARIAEGGVPLLGFGPGFGHRHGHGFAMELEAAASFLGLTEAELRAQLEDGKSLADVAEAEGKSVDGLVDALTAAATERLEQAVEDGRLTEAQKEDLLDGLQERITALVNETPRFHRRFGAEPGADVEIESAA